MKKALIIITIIILLIGGSFVFFGQKRNWFFRSEQSRRQAVFLNNGQVYFGLIDDTNKQFIVLKDIYYLKSEDLAQNNPNQKISLIKMGNELHNPEDEMFINRDNVLFYQDLKNDSKINAAIQKFATKTN